MITSYGYDNFFILFGIGVVFICIGWLTTTQWISVPSYVLGIVIAAFAIWFFRDPPRTIPQEALADSSLLVAPADGKVVQVIPIDEPTVIKGKAIQVSIFLSPLDVHVNRLPATGTVISSEYQPGKYLMAFDPKSSTENEQTVVGLSTAHGPILFKQITGFLARRIVCKLVVGQKVTVGDQFGMMKFGSRMDVIVPAGTVIDVKEGDRVVGGETLLGRLTSAR